MGIPALLQLPALLWQRVELCLGLLPGHVQVVGGLLEHALWEGGRQSEMERLNQFPDSQLRGNQSLARVA